MPYWVVVCIVLGTTGFSFGALWLIEKALGIEH
jgi:hypothetical protein